MVINATETHNFIIKMKLIKKLKKYLKQGKCNHEWREFDSGYKQCNKCRKIVS